LQLANFDYNSFIATNPLNLYKLFFKKIIKTMLKLKMNRCFKKSVLWL